MRKILIAATYVGLALATTYGTYLWGWYAGVSYHAVEAGLSEAKVSLSAAQSLRARDPELALELLEANISWMDASLQFESQRLPEDQRGNYDIVMRRLQSYKQAYAAHGSR